MMVERWQRTDPASLRTIVAPATLHLDGRKPSFEVLDAHCGVHDEYFGGATREKEPSFGTMHLTAPRVGEAEFVGGANTGYDAPDGEPAWDAGDTLRISAEGAELPPFDVEVVVPAVARLTSADLPKLARRELSIPRNEVLELTWEPVETEVFALMLQFNVASYLRRGLWCFFPGNTGVASIPTAVLEHLIPSTEILNTNFYFSGASRQHLDLDDVELQVVTWNGWAARVVVE